VKATGFCEPRTLPDPVPLPEVWQATSASIASAPQETKSSLFMRHIVGVAANGAKPD
jgi:hypothetical protein